MATTVYLLAEQALLRLKDGNPDAATTVEMPDLKLAVCQAINQLYKMEQFNVNLPGGETIPNGCMIATYDNVAVTSYKNVSKSTLPAVPIGLLRNMGVFHISRTNDINNPFIPLQSGQMAMLGGERLLSDLLGQSGYEVYGNEVIYNTDLTAASVTSVFMRLIVADPSSYGDYDVVPVPAEHEGTIVQMVYEKFAGIKPEPRIVDSIKDK